MEDPASLWQIGIIALLAGAMIGVLAYRLLSPSVKQADQIKSERDAARKELDSYKASVNQHFNKTSELVNDLTQNYVKVYQHLAEGAQALGHSKNFDNLLEQRPGKLSIALAEQKAKAAESVDGDGVVDAAAPTVDTVDEHAEPFTGKPAAEAEASADAGNENEAADKIDDPEGSAAAATEDDTLAAATKDTDEKAPAETSDESAAGKPKSEARATAD